MADDELAIIGIIPHSDLDNCHTNYEELHRLFYQGLILGPFLDPLIADLKDKEKIGNLGEI
jgi:hypothetical protein